MKYFLAVPALAGLLMIAACDQNEEESAAETAGEPVFTAPDEGDARTIRKPNSNAPTCGCRAAADALAIWTARPWADAEEMVTGGNVATIRVIRPGDMVTKDYRTDRLNVELDENDVVTRVYCG